MTVADFPRCELSSGWSFIGVDFHWGGLSRGGGGGGGGTFMGGWAGTLIGVDFHQRPHVLLN